MVFVYGWGTKPTPLGITEPRDCSRCGNYGPWLVYQTKKQFKLYWIPVAQWNKKHIVECSICPNSIEVGGNEARRLIEVGEKGHLDRFYKAAAAVLKSGAKRGGPDSHEWDRALQVLLLISEGTIAGTQADRLLRDAQLSDIDNRVLDEEKRLVLLRLAIEVAYADGELQAAEISNLEALADQLAVPHVILRTLIAMITGDGRAASGDAARRTADRQVACEILGVSADATIAEIRVTYRKLVLIHHPDRVSADKREQATQRTSQINAAYDFLLGKSASMPR